MDSRELLRQSEELAQRQARLEGVTRAHPYLQAGEDLESAYPDDAEHWFEVYRELARAKQELIEHVQEKIQCASTPVAAEELRRDEQLWKVELERIQLHRRYWQERVAPAAADPQPSSG